MNASRCALLIVLAGALSAPAARLAASPGQGRTQVIDGYVFVAPGRPVAHGRLRLLTLSGTRLSGTGITGKNGTFTLRAAHLPSRFVLESAGGTDAGRAAPRLRTIVTGRAWRHLVHVNPATTLAAAVAARHPQWPYQATAARVKRYLDLPASATLGRSLHWDGSSFDGGEFLRQAGLGGGFDAFVRARAAEIGTAPSRQRTFRRPGAAARAGVRSTAAATRRADIGTTIITNIAGNVGGAVAKATIGDALAAAGLSNVANFLGLGNASDQLDGIAGQLAGVSSQLTQINTTVDAIQSGVANNNAAITLAQYTSLVTSSSVAGAVSVGTANDAVLSPLTQAASFADDVASEAMSLPKAARSNPQAWCAANPTLLSTGAGAKATSTSYGDACTTILADMGASGGPTQQQIVKAGGPVAWCAAHEATYGSANPLISPLAYYTCEVLTQTSGTFQRGGPSGFDTLYPLASGASGGVSIIQSYGQLLTSKLAVAAGPRAVLLTAANYSTPVDSVLGDWESKIALLGLYASVYDAFTSPGTTTCQVTAGGAVTTLAPADCDIQRGTAYATAFTAAPLALPDIPAGTFVSLSSGTAVGTHSATATHWLLVPEPATCPSSPSFQFAWTGISTPPISVECSFTGSTYSVGNSAGQSDRGWSVPPSGDLQALFTGVANPGKLLTGIGLADLSAARGQPMPPVQSVASAYTVANLWNAAAPPTPTNTGTSYGLWTSSCAPDTWNTGYLSYRTLPHDNSSLYEIVISGTWCSYVGLQDGVLHKQCISVDSTPGIPCNAPTTPGTPTVFQGRTYSPSDGPIDFGHTLALLIERTPRAQAGAAQEYWYYP